MSSVSAISIQGFQQSVQRLNGAAREIARAPATISDSTGSPPRVELDDAIVSMKQASKAAGANIAFIRADQERFDQWMDLLLGPAS